MATYLKFEITPYKTTYPDIPAFELFVKRTVSGRIWTKEEYTWSCLPGYIRENMGSVSYDDYTDVGGKGFCFYLLSRPLNPNEKATNPCYGILNDIPTNFAIGSSGSASTHYGGAKIKELLLQGTSEAVLYSSWKLINVY